MHIARGFEPLFMVLLLFTYKKDIRTRSLSRTVKRSLGERWYANPINVIREATRTGSGPNVSDAFTINGQPVDLYKGSSQGLLM
ncbi:putative laccase [Helianthus anomalus]